MRECGFTLTHILRYKDGISPHTGQYGSMKTRILPILSSDVFRWIKKEG